MAFICLITFLFVLLSSVSACDRCLHRSKASYISQVASGACGYGSLALNFSQGLLAAGHRSIFKGGVGCGDCFKVRCTNQTLCKSDKGTAIMLTDLSGDDRTDFVLAKDVFIAMANNGVSQELLNLGIVDIEYKRVPCTYNNQNLSLRVEDFSNRPYYLAVKILYQGGQTKIISVDVAKVDTQYWTSMERNYGAVWDTNNVPSGPLKFRFMVTSGFDGKYIWTSQVLPSDWETGVIYDAGLQITDVAQENCSSCEDSDTAIGSLTVLSVALGSQFLE